MKLERSNVKFPMWRKKVDSSLFEQMGTTIPNWACHTWKINIDFADCISKKNPKSKVKIVFQNITYAGCITSAKEGRKTPAFRLWFSEDLQYKIKNVFLMSFMRDIEYRLRKDKSINIEDEIPFWEFLDIEFDCINRVFHFTAHYIQKPSFPELFQRMIGSPMLQKIDDELNQKGMFRIYKQHWKKREELDSEIEAENVLYFLIDTTSRRLYIGEAKKLVKRLKQNHLSIPDWNYYRYDVLPNRISSEQRVTLERMLIRDFASVMQNKANIGFKTTSDYALVNDKLDIK